MAIDTESAAEGAIEFLLESLYLRGKGEIPKVLDKVRHNSAFPKGKDLGRSMGDFGVIVMFAISQGIDDRRYTVMRLFYLL
jgi:hypothetical protein